MTVEPIRKVDYSKSVYSKSVTCSSEGCLRKEIEQLRLENKMMRKWLKNSLLIFSAIAMLATISFYLVSFELSKLDKRITTFHHQ